MKPIRGFTLRDQANPDDGTRRDPDHDTNGEGAAPGSAARIEASENMAAPETEPTDPHLHLVARDAGGTEGRDLSTADAERRPRRRTRDRRRWAVVGGAGATEQSRDREFAKDMQGLIQQVNEAFDAAHRMGLVVEPKISTTMQHVGADGVAGHRLAVGLSRKLC